MQLKVNQVSFQFEGAFENCEKRLLASSCLSVRPSVRMEQLEFHRKNFQENVNFSKSKSKSNPVTGPAVAQKGVEVYLYPSKTSALEGSEWSAARTGRTLPPGKTGYPLYRRQDVPQVRSGRKENLAPAGIQFADRPARSQ
jgi:hypothetical protein